MLHETSKGGKESHHHAIVQLMYLWFILFENQNNWPDQRKHICVKVGDQTNFNALANHFLYNTGLKIFLIISYRLFGKNILNFTDPFIISIICFVSITN